MHRIQASFHIAVSLGSSSWAEQFRRYITSQNQYSFLSHLDSASESTSLLSPVNYKWIEISL